MASKFDKILVIDSTDFIKYKRGGTLSFDINILKVFQPDELYLVGYVDDGEPIGKWFKRKINKKYYNYMGIALISKVKSSKLPDRIYSLLSLLKYIKVINEIPIKFLLTQSPHFVFAIPKIKNKKFCFYFAGLGNSVSFSKYQYLRFLGGIYEKMLFKVLNKNADIILAAADQIAIKNKLKKYNWPNDRIKFFPTRFDNKIFYPFPKYEARKKLNISHTAILLLSTGRLSHVKGWKLLIDSFLIFQEKKDDSLLFFLGDGEDRLKIEEYIEYLDLSSKIRLLGNVELSKLSLFLNASDLFVMGSIIEGWPTSMVEALACGKPIVSTRVSGVSEMIDHGRNGYIVKNRDCELFAKYCQMAIELKNVMQISLGKAEKYSLHTLKQDLFDNCEI